MDLTLLQLEAMYIFKCINNNMGNHGGIKASSTPCGMNMDDFITTHFYITWNLHSTYNRNLTCDTNQFTFWDMPKPFWKLEISSDPIENYWKLEISSDPMIEQQFPHYNNSSTIVWIYQQTLHATQVPIEFIQGLQNLDLLPK